MPSNSHNWAEIGLPQQIVTWLETMSKSPHGVQYLDRAKRLAKFAAVSFEQEEKLRKAWKALENAANREPKDAIICIFMLLPDKPERAPFELLYGKRDIYPDEEKSRYNRLLGHVIEVEKFMNPHRPAFQNMLRDSTATPDAHQACIEFREVEYEFFAGLKKLHALLEVIDPKAKIPTEHWKSDGAAIKNYVILVSALNRYLSKPQHAALAALANANYPNGSITADQLRKAWENGADKRS